MLDAMRKRTGSLVVKLFIGLLAASFAVWGIGDIFRGSQDPTVAEVGSTSIRASALQAEYNRALESLRAATGGQIDAEQARAFGIVDRALDGLIARTIVTREVRSLGLFTPDAAVADSITNNPSFQDEAGTFNRLLYQSVLRQNRMGETEYEELVREQLSQEQLIVSMAAGLSVPDAAVEALRRYREERRVATVAMITPDNAGEAPTPDDAAVAEFYADNESSFMAPEYRRITLITLKPGDLLDEVEIDEARVEEEYEFRLDTYTIPHRRDIDRLVFNTEDDAAAAFERLMSGDDFFALGAELTGQSESDVSLGFVVKEDLPSEEVADAIFALDVRRVSAPIETPFGWYVVRINEDLPGRVTPFEEVADEIRNELKIEQASDAVYELGNSLEDERAGGASIEEAANSLGITVEKIGPVSQAGLTPEGEPAANLPPIQELFSTAFASELEAETDLIETDGNITYALRVDQITAPALRPLEDVREDAIAAWQKNWRDEQSKALAEKIAARVADGEDLTAVASEDGVDVLSSEAFARDGRDLAVAAGPNFIEAVFALEPGESTEAIINGTGRYAVASLDEVIPADSAEAEDTLDTIRGQMQRSVQGDVEAAFGDALRRKYGVKVNQNLVDNLFGIGTAAP